MKRFVSLFAAVLIAAVFAFSPSARAASEVVFSMNNVDGVKTGDSFEVTLSISGDYAVHGMNLSIEFDPAAMTLENVEEGGYLKTMRSAGNLVVLDSDTLKASGQIKLAVLCPTDPASGSGEMFKMKFHVNSGVTVNQQVLMIIHELIYMPIGSTAGTNVAFKTDNSIITLVGGSVPSDGYNEGDSGIGDNISSSKVEDASKTRDPNSTPSAVVSNPPDPSKTGAPSRVQESGEPASASPTSELNTITTNEPANQAENAVGNKKTFSIVGIALGAVLVCAAAAAIIVVVNKRKS